MSKRALQIYEFGLFRLFVEDRILLHGDDTVHLTDKVFNILLLLVQRSGHLVTKEEILEQVWPDTIIEESNLTVSMSSLRKALGERHEGVPYIETVSKRGYRFIARVRELEDETLLLPARQTGSRTNPTATTLNPATATLAVLPLHNVSDDPNLEYLSDGITESIINSLARFPQLKVLARSTMFRFKRTELDPLEVGRQLHAHTLLTGRILQINEELITRLELLNIKEGSQIWGAQYQRKYADIFEAQEKISQEVSEDLKLRLASEHKSPAARGSALLGYAFALSGRPDEARQTLKALRETATERYVDPVSLALIYTGLNERDQAFEYLEKAYERRSASLALLSDCPLFSSLRSDPRFTSLVRRSGLPQ